MSVKLLPQPEILNKHFNLFTWRHVLNMYLPLLKLGESSPDMAMSNHCIWILECIFDAFSTSFPSGVELKIFQLFLKIWKRGGPCANPFSPSTRTHPKIQICTESLCQKECFKICGSRTGSTVSVHQAKNWFFTHFTPWAWLKRSNFNLILIYGLSRYSPVFGWN